MSSTPSHDGDADGLGLIDGLGDIEGDGDMLGLGLADSDGEPQNGDPAISRHSCSRFS